MLAPYLVVIVCFSCFFSQDRGISILYIWWLKGSLQFCIQIFFMSLATHKELHPQPQEVFLILF